MGTLDTSHVVRREFRGFIEIGNAIRLPDDDRRRALNLSEREWADWTRLLTDGPLPERPVLPEMLRRLGSACYCLTMMAESVRPKQPGLSA